jgi:hypothetical protein
VRRPETDIPLGAILVVVAGLLLTAAAALLTVGENEGGAFLEWDESASIPDSANSSGRQVSAKIVGAEIQSTRSNASGYRLFRISAGLHLETARNDDRATATCTVSVPPRTVLGRTPGKRASYPLPSEDLAAQGVPAGSIIRFGAKGTDLVNVAVDDAFDHFTSAPGVKVEWAPYRQGEQTWNWILTDVKRPDQAVRLDFATLWRTTARPGATIACKADDGGATVKAKTTGGL